MKIHTRVIAIGYVLLIALLVAGSLIALNQSSPIVLHFRPLQDLGPLEISHGRDPSCFLTSRGRGEGSMVAVVIRAGGDEVE